MCNGDGSTCLPGSRDSVARNSTSTKKEVTPGAANLITSALDWLKRMGYDVDRRGQIASPESTTKGTQKEDFYWAVVKSGCSVSCGGGSAAIDVCEIIFNFCDFIKIFYLIFSRKQDSSSKSNQLKCVELIMSRLLRIDPIKRLFVRLCLCCIFVSLLMALFLFIRFGDLLCGMSKVRRWFSSH